MLTRLQVQRVSSALEEGLQEARAGHIFMAAKPTSYALRSSVL